ncbi:MAG: DUF3368 domain-containing protein [Spirochaetaceae bacterium]|nr:DUF3368 domain-containing protein [Spirochaetaceae bacterium]
MNSGPEALQGSRSKSGLSSTMLTTGSHRPAVTLAVRTNADTLLADDRIIRRIAMVHGVRPIGTVGVLLRAMRQGRINSQEVRRILDDLIGRHSFRIGVELYAAVLREVDAPS